MMLIKKQFLLLKKLHKLKKKDNFNKWSLREGNTSTYRDLFFTKPVLIFYQTTILAQ